MRYKSFRIQNFKGIKDTTIRLDSVAGAAVFAFVGLNESGKTTVLEAIHSFLPDDATSELLGGGEGVGVPIKERVPRHLVSEFTGKVSVLAEIELDDSDKKRIIGKTYKHGVNLNPETIPNIIFMERWQDFSSGDFLNHYFSLKHKFEVKTGKQRKWRSPNDEERLLIRNTFSNLIPSIAYFPTFVFDFPESIFLTNRGGIKDRFYRKVFQDILDYDGRDQTIEQHIVRRLRQPQMIMPWQLFFAQWSAHDDRRKIQHVMDRASAAVTKLVFGRWNTIFGEDTKGKEVLIDFDIIEGEIENDDGVKIKTEEHDIKIRFQIKDGTRRFNVNDRSLGFRWFFSFMIFTQFRVARSGSDSRPLLFLFDEPASNLHAAAQLKLIDSFPEIARNGHFLAYSTHSHYMIEPKWLEQTFIVTNRADDPADSVLDGVSLDDESLDISVTTYRNFVNKNPGQTSYFQPILDRLDVVPSRFDMKKASIVLEGKSDYYILRYAQRMLDIKEVSFLPGLGAGTLGALAALSAGWNLNFLFMLDGDAQGKRDLKRYHLEYGIPAHRLLTISDIVKDAKCIEDILDKTALNHIQQSLSLDKTPTKSQIKRYFQESLSTGNTVKMGASFTRRAKAILERLEERLLES